MKLITDGGDPGDEQDYQARPSTARTENSAFAAGLILPGPSDQSRTHEDKFRIIFGAD